jgi:ribosomal protein S18 acetylase RimI-like enzyme
VNVETERQATVRFSQEDDLDGESVDQVRGIYEEAFPPAERLAFQEILAALRQGGRWLFVAKVGGDVVGFAVVTPLEKLSAYLLEYMAVAAPLRDKGIGGRLFEFVADSLRAIPGAMGILLEVEPDDAGPDRDLRRRRIAFYLRYGVQEVGCAPKYRMPDLGGSGEVPMKLMWLALGTASDLPRAERLREYIQAIYVQGYGRGPDDQLLLANLRDLAC